MNKVDANATQWEVNITEPEKFLNVEAEKEQMVSDLNGQGSDSNNIIEKGKKKKKNSNVQRKIMKNRLTRKKKMKKEYALEFW